MENLIDISISVGAWIKGAIVLIGMIQYLKGAFPKAPAWVWTIAVPLLAAGYAFAPPVVQDAAGVLAASQLGYEGIVKRFKGGGQSAQANQ